MFGLKKITWDFKIQTNEGKILKKIQGKTEACLKGILKKTNQ